MTPRRFSKPEALQFGWTTTKSNLGFFIVVLIVVAVVHLFPILISDSFSAMPDLAAMIQFVTFVLSIIVYMGLIKITLLVCDNKQPQLSHLFSCFPLLLKYLIGSILYILIVFGGMALFIFLGLWGWPEPPSTTRLVIVIGGLVLFIFLGVVWAMKFYFYNYLIIDMELGPIEALKGSAAITKDARWEVFVFDLLVTSITVLGLLALLVGLFLAIPVTMVATAFVYRRLLAQSPPVERPSFSG